MRGKGLRKRALVLGGSWFIGRAVVEALLARGLEVTTLNRGVSPVEYSGEVERVKADRRRPDEFRRALEGLEADFLIDVTAYRAGHTRMAIEAFRGRIERAVHISTLSAYRLPAPCPIGEDWPLKDEPSDSYGFHKAECERVLEREAEGPSPWSSLRLPVVYGPNDTSSRELFFARRILEGRAIVIPEEGPFLCQNVFVADVAEAACRLLESPRAAGRAYNLGSAPFGLEAYLRLAGKLLGKAPRIVKLPLDELEGLGVEPDDIPYFFPGNLVMDTERLAGEVGFRPRVGLEEGLKMTFEGLRAGAPPEEESLWELPPEAEKRALALARKAGRVSPA